MTGVIGHGHAAGQTAEPKTASCQAWTDQPASRPSGSFMYCCTESSTWPTGQNCGLSRNTLTQNVASSGFSEGLTLLGASRDLRQASTPRAGKTDNYYYRSTVWPLTISSPSNVDGSLKVAFSLFHFLSHCWSRVPGKIKDTQSRIRIHNSLLPSKYPIVLRVFYR